MRVNKKAPPERLDPLKRSGTLVKKGYFLRKRTQRVKDPQKEEEAESNR